MEEHGIDANDALACVQDTIRDLDEVEDWLKYDMKFEAPTITILSVSNGIEVSGGDH